MTGAAIVLDNPILMKHVRSRLRRAQLIPWTVVVLVLSLCIAWAGASVMWLGMSGALGLLIGLQALTLTFAGAGQLGTAVAGARESGILDFHRVSPLPPLWVALGFFLGAPIREYVLVACTLPFAVLCAAMGPAGPIGLVEVEVTLLLVSWIFHAIALLSALLVRKPKAGPKGGVGAIIFLLFFLGQPLGWLVWYAAGQLQLQTPRPEFFGLPLHWMVFLLIYEVPLLGFLFVASARKMRADRTHCYTKPLAIAALGTAAVVTLGGLWTVRDVGGVVVGVLYGLMVVALVVVTTITPDFNEYLKGVRRAHRLGQRRPSPWADAGTNRVALAILCGIVLVGAQVAWEAIEGRPAGGRGTYSQTIAVGVLVVAYYGLALQYFLLRFPRTGATMMTLFIFLAWLVPLVAGVITLAAAPPEEVSSGVLGLSPITGIAMSTGPGRIDDRVADVARLAALTPAVTFAFGFNLLLVALQRRIDRAVHRAEGDAEGGRKVGPDLTARGFA